MAKKTQVINNHGTSGGLYFVTYIGAAIYFINQASTFGGDLLGILKAFVWPAFVVYHVLTLLHA